MAYSLSDVIEPLITPLRTLRWSNKLAINKVNLFGNHLRLIDDEDTRSVVATRSSAFSRATISKDSLRRRWTKTFNARALGHISPPCHTGAEE